MSITDTSFLSRASRALRAHTALAGDVARAFSRDQRGAVALIFGLAAIPMLGMVGASVDYTRASQMNANYQDAADAAALAAATTAHPSFEARQDFARAVFAANAPEAGHTLTRVDLLEVSDGYEVRAVGKIEATLMGVMGVNAIDIGVSSVAAASSAPLEIAFVIDATQSMTFGNRWQVAHESLEDMLTVLDEAAENGGQLTVTAIPMGDRINIGTERFRWVEGFQGDARPDDDDDGRNNGRRGHWNDEERERDGDQGRRGNRDRDGHGDDDDYADDRLPRSAWGGCVNPREEDDGDNPYLLTDVGPGDLPFEPLDHREQQGEHDERWMECPQAIVGPTADIQDVIFEMRNLRAAGTGRFDTGMAWAWRALSANWAGEWGLANYPATDDLTRKVVVFISDGNSTMEDVEFDGHSEWGWNNSGAAMFDNLATVCSDMKAQGIEIFMFYINGNPHADDYFRDCASSPSHYFDVTTNDAMASAFESIGSQLVEARLVR